MRQVIVKGGGAVLETVPAPVVSPGMVLVQNLSSCISIGTEMSSVRSSSMPLWQRALKQPDNLKKGLAMMKEKGVVNTMQFVKGKVDAGNAVGYSCAGVVLEVGEGVTDLFKGDLVACAGAGFASHAEIVTVPRNLVVAIPEGVSVEEASTVTLGAIAMQGVRRANPTLGETFVVVGLGILGQMTVQFLKANGCRVLGIDLQKSRVDRALEMGMDADLSSEDAEADAFRLTEGNGVDGVIITAASPSDQILSSAFKYCRRKGRVVVVGDVGLNINRGDIYQKELDFLISTSYGPGRYDEQYEMKGLEYPISYVRWTENRNMQEYLRLIQDKRMDVKSLIDKTYDLDNVTEAYESLKTTTDQSPLLVLLNYPENMIEGLSTQMEVNKNFKKDGKINVAVVGAGGFAKAVHLPNFTKEGSYTIHSVVTRSGHNSKVTASQYGAKVASTSFEDVVGNKDVDLVAICTRHNQHAEMTKKALLAGKHVLVEKPMSLTEEDLKDLKKVSTENGQLILLTGFNRRFSPHVEKIKQSFKKRNTPMVINYVMNAGYIPKDHWVHGEEGGGRNIGEACHIYDLFTYLTNSEVKTVFAHSIQSKDGAFNSNDNFSTTISFTDGSIATLTYTALGSKKHPKERMTVFCDGKVAELDDYYKSCLIGAGGWTHETKTSEKGHFEEIRLLAQSIKGEAKEPIPLWQQFQASEIAFEVERQIQQ